VVQLEVLFPEKGGKGFYKSGCQVKTLLLLEEGFVLLGIQPPSMIPAILNARVRPGFSMDEGARRRWFGAWASFGVAVNADHGSIGGSRPMAF
jgi:hypothetical protein